MKTEGTGKITRKLIDLTDQRFGRLRALAYNTDKRKWRCVCDCGSTHFADSTNLRRGDTRSCGCLNTESRKRTMSKNMTTHGLRHTPEYNIWAGIKQRTTNPNDPAFKNYGGRGIIMCDRWRDSFEAFYADVGVRPNSKMTLDRIDNDGNYEPANVRWASRTTQVRNRRVTKRYAHDGLNLTLTEWSERTGIKRSTLDMRIRKGWSIENALTIPACRKNRRHG